MYVFHLQKLNKMMFLLPESQHFTTTSLDPVQTSNEPSASLPFIIFNKNAWLDNYNLLPIHTMHLSWICFIFGIN